MSEKNDSSLSRMMAVLDLFTERCTDISAEQVSDTLGVSLPTSYRYLKTLSDAGLLHRSAQARYTLGPRIVMLDHLMRQADPILKFGTPILQAITQQTGFDCVVSSMHGGQMLDTHREYAANPASLSFGRGRPRPLFLGAAPKIILAGMNSSALRRLFEAQAPEAEAAGLPADWPSFRAYYARIRKAGYYFSNGELEPELAALAVPLLSAEGETLASLSVVAHVRRMAVIDLNKLTQLLQRSARALIDRLD